MLAFAEQFGRMCLKEKNHMYLRKICPRLIKKKTSGMETFYLSLTLTKAAFVDAFKAFN